LYIKEWGSYLLHTLVINSVVANTMDRAA